MLDRVSTPNREKIQDLQSQLDDIEAAGNEPARRLAATAYYSALCEAERDLRQRLDDALDVIPATEAVRLREFRNRAHKTFIEMVPEPWDDGNLSRREIDALVAYRVAETKLRHAKDRASRFARDLASRRAIGRGFKLVTVARTPVKPHRRRDNRQRALAAQTAAQFSM